MCCGNILVKDQSFLVLKGVLYISLSLREISGVMVPILVDTNPYSLKKRKYEEVSGSGHAAYASSIRARILSESNSFRGMEYPMSGTRH